MFKTYLGNKIMIYFFLEGPDDENLIRGILKDGNDESKYNYYLYARKSDEKIKNFIKSIKAMGEKCLFLTDSDGDDLLTKLKNIKSKFSNLTDDDIFIICHEIESWYFAGVSASNKGILKMKQIERDTDELTKEQFNKLINLQDAISQGETRLTIMLQMIQMFDLGLAELHNKSFSIFYNKNKILF